VPGWTASIPLGERLQNVLGLGCRSSPRSSRGHRGHRGYSGSRHGVEVHVGTGGIPSVACVGVDVPAKVRVVHVIPSIGRD